MRELSPQRVQHATQALAVAHGDGARDADAERRGLALAAQQLEQFGYAPLAHHLPLAALDRREALDGARTGRLEQRAGAVEEELAVRLVGLVEHAEVVAEVVREDALLV